MVVGCSLEEVGRAGAGSGAASARAVGARTVGADALEGRRAAVGHVWTAAGVGVRATAGLGASHQAACLRATWVWLAGICVAITLGALFLYTTLVVKIRSRQMSEQTVCKTKMKKEFCGYVFFLSKFHSHIEKN